MSEPKTCATCLRTSGYDDCLWCGDGYSLWVSSSAAWAEKLAAMEAHRDELTEAEWEAVVAKARRGHEEHGQTLSEMDPAGEGVAEGLDGWTYVALAELQADALIPDRGSVGTLTAYQAKTHAHYLCRRSMEAAKTYLLNMKQLDELLQAARAAAKEAGE